MPKFGFVVSFPATIVFSIEAETEDMAQEIIKDIMEDFNPDDVRLEYDADLNLLKLSEKYEV
jgi:non-homologous end joining protein Ku